MTVGKGGVSRRRSPGERAPAAALDRFGALQPQEVILGLLGEYVGSREKVWSGGLVRLLRDLGFSAPASRIALNRVVTRGLLSPSRDGRFIFYSITPRLAAVHQEGRRRVFARVASPAWDGNWTLVRYSIPEALRPQRARLSRWMSFRGFGPLQDGIWLSAGDRRREVLPLARDLGLARHVMVLVGVLPSHGAVHELAGEAWNLAALAKMYDRFMRTFAPYADGKTVSCWEPRECFVMRTRLIEMFRQTAAHDPNLPDRVLRLKWKRREAIMLFHRLEAILREGAREHFRANAIR